VALTERVRVCMCVVEVGVWCESERGEEVRGVVQISKLVPIACHATKSKNPAARCRSGQKGRCRVKEKRAVSGATPCATGTHHHCTHHHRHTPPPAHTHSVTHNTHEYLEEIRIESNRRRRRRGKTRSSILPHRHGLRFCAPHFLHH